MTGRVRGCRACGNAQLLPTRSRRLRLLAFLWLRAYRCRSCYARVWRIAPWWRGF